MADVLVIGGGPAGMSAALNVLARGKRPLVLSSPLEENPLWRAGRIDNCLGFPGLSGQELLRALRRHAEAAGVEFRTGRVLSALRSGSDWYVSIGPDMEHAPALILAAGVVRYKKLPGEEALLGRGVSYCATCDGMLYRGRRVAVLGYDDSAREEVRYLQEIGCDVVFFDRPKSAALTGTDRVRSVTCDGVMEEVEGVFILRPAMAPGDLLPGLAAEGGFVAVDRRMAANLPGVFAAGDCTGNPLQLSKAMGEGLVAGQNAAAYVSQTGKD